MTNIIKNKTYQFGLLYRPSFSDSSLNGLDWVDGYSKKDKHYDMSDGEFTTCNREILENLISDQCRLIVEIGVDRNDLSSTKTILNKKHKDCAYLGIDIANKQYLENKNNNIFVSQQDSSETQLILDKLNELQLGEEIDILVIDGNHSINNCFADFLLAEKVKVGGYIVLHDINQHPGPKELMDAVDQNVFSVERYCPNDFGIGVLRRK